MARKLLQFALPLLMPVLLATAPAAQAQDVATTQAILTAFDDWVAAHDITAAALAVGHDGRLLADSNLGRDPDAAYPIASLSKAITAACLHSLLDEADMTFGATLGDVSDALAGLDLTVPAHARGITLGALATMSAGLSVDITQGTFNRYRGYGETRNIGYAREALAPDAWAGEPGLHAYNNGNYAILGAVIEAVTGTDNVTACAPHVLGPAGITTGGFDAHWIALAAFGGWTMSANDYLRFIMHSFRPESPLNTRLAGLPETAHGNGAYYGFGTNFRPRGDRLIHWHFGTICVGGGRDAGAYFAYYENGYAVSANYTGCLDSDMSRALDFALWTAAHP